MRSEGIDWKAVGVQPAAPDPLQPVGLNDMDALAVALAEEALAVFGRGG